MWPSYRPPMRTARPRAADPRTWWATLRRELEQKILSLGPETVAAFIFEPIVGAAGGVVPAPPGYVTAVQAVCRKYDVLLIADEVMCGAGRSGTLARHRVRRGRPRHHEHRQGARRRLHSARRHARRASDFGGHARRARCLYDGTYLFRPYGGLRGGARGPAHHRARPAPRARAHCGSGIPGGGARLAGALRGGRRCARTRILHRHRTGARPADPGAFRPGAGLELRRSANAPSRMASSATPVPATSTASRAIP